jgi:hypothetical protein
MDDLFGDRPKTTPSTKKRGAGASLLADMIEKDDRDWLDMAAGGSDSSRPRTAPEGKKATEDVMGPARGRGAAAGKEKTGNSGYKNYPGYPIWLYNPEFL